MFRHKKLVFLAISGLILLSFTLSQITPTTEIGSNTTESKGIQPNLANSPTDNVTIEFYTRDYVIDNYGLIYITDQYQIVNNRSSPLLTFDFCISDEEAMGLCFYGAETVEKGSLAVRILPEKENGYTQLQVVFQNPILPYSSDNITVQLVLRDMLSYNPYTNQYLIYCEVVPILPYISNGYRTSITVPSGSTEITYTPGGVTTDNPMKYGTNTTQSAYTRHQTKLNYINAQTPMLKFTNVDRTIEIHPLGYIRVTEIHNLKSFGVPQVYTFILQVPENAYNVTAKDHIGKISDVTLASTENTDSSKNISFTLYGTATSNRGVIRYDTVFYYQLEYYLPIDEYFTKSISKNDLIIDTFTTKSDFIILEQTTTLKLIGAYKISRCNIEIPEVIKSTDGISITFVDTYITKYHNQYIDLSFQIDFFSLFSRALLYSFIAIGVFSLYIFRKTVKKPEDESEIVTERAIPIRELRQFVTLYEERNAIQLDIEKSDEDLIKKKIQKKAYNKTVKTYQDKVKQIDEEIRPFKKELLESVEKITKVIQQLDYLEAERLSVKDSIALLQDRYKKGKLPSRAAYDRLSSDLIKRIEDIQRKTDRNLNDLRAYLI